MATTTAKTKKDVDQMSRDERLYDSLSYTYGKKGERTQREYDKAKSQADRQILSRGMGRSSAALQTLANIDKQKIDALDDNESALIADYENRLAQYEQMDAEDARWQKQFEEGQRQFDEGLAENARQREWQSGENVLNREWQTSERLGQQEWQSGENKANREWQTAENLAQRTWQSSENTAQRDWQSNENAISRAFTTSEREASQTWQSNENELSRAAQRDLQILQQEFTAGENAKDRESREALQILQNAFTAEQNALDREQTSERMAAEQDRWQQQFDYDRMSDDQQRYFSIAATAASLGNDVSDDLLAQAGISREDFNAMKTQAAATSSSGRGGNNSHPDYTEDGVEYTWDANKKHYVVKTPAAPPPNNNANDPLGLGNTTSTYKAVNPQIARHVESKIGSPNVANKIDSATEARKNILINDLKKKNGF